MNPIHEFVSRFNASISLDKKLLVKEKKRYFLLNEELKKVIRREFYYAGVYLGKVKNNKFFPSFELLNMIARKEANKVFVDKKSAWLFICGRDIFRQGLVKVHGSKKKSSYTLVLNQHGECLGFGRILDDLSEEGKGVAIRNISDVGDFLRREARKHCD